MGKTSASVLKTLAALIWYAGGAVLALKAYSLMIEADALQPGLIWPWVGLGLGLTIGAVKSRYVFRRSCRRNLARIDQLVEPRIWQFFALRFFILLTLMIATGATLSRLAHGSYPFLIAVAGLDISIGTALLVSGLVFWQDWTQLRNSARLAVRS